jgi:hypothetical protein
VSAGATDVRPVVAIVPAKDAAATVAGTVRALVALRDVDEVVVVDDGSSDDTTAAARAAGGWVLRLPDNRGKAGAVAAGVGLAPHAGTYLLVDADVGPTASAVSALLAPVLAGLADMAIGVLPGAGRKGGFGLVRRLAGWGIRRATGTKVEAPLSGQRAVRGDLLRSCPLAARFGLETGLTIDARRAGARVVEVPVGMDHRHTGRTARGFAHRGRQGADVARALWPRLTSAPTRLALIALALCVALVAALWSGSRWEASSVALGGRPSKVLIVGMPGLRWDEVGTGRLPNLDGLVRTGAVAAMTVRTLSHTPSPAEAYATLGAGTRVKGGSAAGQAHDIGQGIGGDIGEGVVVPAAARARAQAGANLSSLPGALGDALHAAGKRTGVVGNADTPSGLAGLPGLHPDRRPVAIGLMDHSGRVDVGAVQPEDVLMTDSTAAFGERADPDAMVAKTTEAMRQADVVLVDSGDLDRAADLRAIAPPAYADRFRSRALDWTDTLLGRLVAAAPAGTLVLVASTQPPGDTWRLTPLVVSGPGVPHGYALSPSTRRLGLVTLTDLAPTVLGALGVGTPEAMVGHALRYHPAARPSVARLGHLDRDVAYRERIYLGVTLWFIAFQAVAYAAVAAVLTVRRRWRWSRLLADVALAIASFPLATLLLRIAVPHAPGLGADGAAVLLPALAAVIVAVARRARRSALAPLAWVLGVTASVIVADIVTGGRLQTGSILGYSPQSAGRYYGIGNTIFAVLAACVVLGAAIHVQRAPRRRDALAFVAAVFVVVVVVDGAPGLGDDVGGIITLVPVFALTLVALSGRRLTWRTLATAGGAAAAALAAATAIDLLRPPDARTHLGRLASATLHHGPGQLLTTIARKWDANIGLLRQTPWSWAVPVIAGFLLYVLVVRRRWTELLPPGSPLRIGVVAALAAGILGFAVNDSGVVVTALVLVEIGPLLAILALARPPGQPVLLEPAEDAPARPRPPMAVP